jgi:hypothetical protein
MAIDPTEEYHKAGLWEKEEDLQSRHWCNDLITRWPSLNDAF